MKSILNTMHSGSLVLFLFMLISFNSNAQSNSKGSETGYFYFSDYNLLVEKSVLHNDFYTIKAQNTGRHTYAFAKIRMVENTHVVMVSLYDNKKQLVTSISYNYSNNTSRQKIKYEENGMVVEKKLPVFELTLLD